LTYLRNRENPELPWEACHHRNNMKNLFKIFLAEQTFTRAESVKQANLSEIERLKIAEDKRKYDILQAEVNDENKANERKAKQKQARDEKRKRQEAIKKSKEVVKSSKCRIPRDADDFEEVCAEWMRRNGFPDAQKTPKGPDGGIDVLSANAVAQSKLHGSNKISAPDIQALAGSRLQHRRRIALFFHYGPGYTDQAIEAAMKTRVRLYQLDVKSKSMKLISGGPQA
jgi:hypothetical protein